MIWRVEVSADGETWTLWGQHPAELEANMQRDEYLSSHPGHQARVTISD